MNRAEIIAVDFDGCLCEDAWPSIGMPIQENINKLRRRQRAGAKIILWTCRSGKHLNEAVRWCEEQGIIFDAVNANLPEHLAVFDTDSRKIYADEYWDDHAVLVR